MKRLYYTPIYSKSRDYLVEKLIKTVAGGKKAIYVLPSREAMFDVRKRVMDKMGSIYNIYILGYDDLERLLCAGYISAERTINDNIATMIIGSVSETLQREEKLQFFSGVAMKSGFSRAVLSAIKRLKRLCLTPEAVENRLYGNPFLEKKSIDIAMIYKRYEEYKKDKCLYDINDVSAYAAEAVKQTDFLKEVSLFVVDGFINIDPINKQLMRNICSTYSDTGNAEVLLLTL